MNNHKNEKWINFKERIGNNAGFSLAELIIAVAILAVIVVPVMHSFVTSSNVSTKSQKLGEATDCADNIMELLNSTSVEKFMNCDADLAKILQGESKDTVKITADEGNSDDHPDQLYYVTNLASGSSEFDAKVTITPGVQDHEKTGKFFELNSKDIASYLDPDGTFVQPYENEVNPDSTMDESITYTQFAAKSGVAYFTNKQRTIVIDVSTNAAKNKVYIYITYNYLFTYAGGGKDKSVIISRKYAVFPGGQAVHSDGKAVSAYIMYYPFFKESLDVNTYNGVNQGEIDSFSNQDLRTSEGISVRFNGDEDKILINNLSDVNVKLFLVKQMPARYDPDTQSYSLYELEAGNPKHLTEGYNLSFKELTYKTTITETRSVDYVDGYNNQTYSNAAYFLTEDATYKGKKIANLEGQDYYNIVTKPMMADPASDNIDGSLINLEKRDRIYYVGITLYKKGEMNKKDAKPVYTMEGSALT